MWATAAACPAARAAAAAAGARTSRAAPPPTNRRRISSTTSSSPRAKARVRAMASRGRRSPGASASNTHSTRWAQSAAHAATIRRSRSLSVCGEPIATSLQRIISRPIPANRAQSQPGASHPGDRYAPWRDQARAWAKAPQSRREASRGDWAGKPCFRRVRPRAPSARAVARSSPSRRGPPHLPPARKHNRLRRTASRRAPAMSALVAMPHDGAT